MSIFGKIVEYYLGHKYYAVILNRVGTAHAELSGLIFESKGKAEQFVYETATSNRSYKVFQLVSFRSKNHYRIAYDDTVFGGPIRNSVCTVSSEIPAGSLPSADVIRQFTNN